MTKFPMTVQGAENLRAELEKLKKEKPAVSQAIAEAREHGDLKENAEYHAAREQMGFLEGRIQDIEARLSNVQIIDITTIAPGDKVIFGVTVTVIHCETDKKVTYKIVGEYEADVNKGLISLTSPIARALIGKEVGDTVIVKAPSGDIEYEIDTVQHI
jgi:transcription elongation factor GreA